MKLCVTDTPVSYVNADAVTGPYGSLLEVPEPSSYSSVCLLPGSHLLDWTSATRTTVDGKDMTACIMLELPTNRLRGIKAEAHEGWAEEVILTIS